MKAYVLIKSYEPDEVVDTIECTELSVYRVDRGVNINLDHENYYTEIQIGEE